MYMYMCIGGFLEGKTPLNPKPVNPKPTKDYFKKAMEPVEQCLKEICEMYGPAGRQGLGTLNPKPGLG